MKSLGVLGAAALVLTLGTAAAAERRGLGAHEHGHGSLNIAIEGQTVAMELEAPGADIVGFEHPAESAADRARIDAAVAILAEPQKLFLLPAAAECVVAHVDVALIAEGEEHHDEAHSEEHHDEAHSEEHHDEAHADEHHDEAHAEEHHDEAHADEHHDEAHAEEHHDEAHAEESHTEFHAEYTLTCAAPSRLDRIDFAYFDVFPNAEELEIQLISDRGSQGFEVERDAPTLDLGGTT